MVSLLQLAGDLPFVIIQVLTALAADEDQKLLLYVDYVCSQMGIAIPWDDIARIMEPRDLAQGEKPMTGEAIKQHMAKLRDHRSKNNLDVPPKLDRNVRRQVAAGKNMHTLQSPVPTPTTFGPFPSIAFVHSKAQITQTETPPKKGSSLLAPVSKSKQKRAEKAMKVALGIVPGDTPGNKSRKTAASGVKATTGKRGRRPAAEEDEDEYRDGNAAIGVSTGRQLRHPERKDYTGMALDSEDTDIKDEPDSEDDLPLSKRRNTAEQSERRKKAAVGLMDEAMQMWHGRGTETAVTESAARSPEAEHAVEPVIDEPGNVGAQMEESNNCQLFSDQSDPFVNNSSNIEHQKERPNPLQLAFPRIPIETGHHFYHDNDYQTAGPHGRADQEFRGDTFITNRWPQLASAHPSPMDDNFAMGTHAPGHGLRLQGSGAGYFTTPQTSPAYGQMSHQMIGNEPYLTSSPLHGSLSSGTFPGADFCPGFGSDYSQLTSRKTSYNSSSSTTQAVQDTFSRNNSIGNFAGLPFTTPNTNPSNRATSTYPLASPIGYDMKHQNPDTGNQVTPSFVDPNLTKSGLGISMPPQSCGDNFDHSTVAHADYPLPSTEVCDTYLTQHAMPDKDMNSYGLASPQDHTFNFSEFIVDLDAHAGFGQLPSNDFVG